MSNTLVARLPLSNHVSSPTEPIQPVVQGNASSTTNVVPMPKRCYAAIVSQNLVHKAEVITRAAPIVPIPLNKVNPQCIPRKSHKKNSKRRNGKAASNGCGALSPSAISSCSLVSIATTSSGLSSVTGSITAINEEIPPCSDSVAKSPSSAASSAGFCDMTSTDDVDEDFHERSASLNYCDDPLFFEPCLEPPFSYSRQWSAPAQTQQKSRNGKKYRKNHQRGNCEPDLSNPEIQEYFHQQKLFYRIIYEQEFAVLRAITLAKNGKEFKILNSKINGYAPHQHLGLPPLPPPICPTSSWYYQSYTEPLLEIQSHCEAIFFQQLKNHAISRPKKMQQKNQEKNNSGQTFSLPKNLGENDSNTELRAEFCRQIRERLLGTGESVEKLEPKINHDQTNGLNNLSNKPMHVYNNQTLNKKKWVSSNPPDLTASEGESGYQSESLPASGTETGNEQSKCNGNSQQSKTPRVFESKEKEENVNPKLTDPGKVDKNDKSKEISGLDYLSDSICDYYETVAQTEKTLLNKLRLRDMLYYLVAPIYPLAGLYIVGSSLNGFGNEKSDMDLCLMITDKEIDQRTDAINVLKTVETVLSTHEYVKSYQLIEAKVPILRVDFCGPYDGLTVDLNANNSVAIRNTHLLFYYAFSDWRIRPLVAIVKEWAKRCNINNASQSSFTSYSLVLMVIHYLQCGLDKPVIPSLQHLYAKRFNNKLDIRHLNISISIPPSPCENPDISVAELLIGFFKYYASVYDYEKNVISVRLGKPVERSAVIKNNRTQWSPIVIEEPFTQSNTAHSIFDQNVFDAIKLKFQEAYNILNETRDINELLSVKPYQSPYFIP
uniref:PAP-associated domain-containing protein n=1 Tax=Panagrolaimus sp. JU765 TaxID=591449 RepID=A0AC34QSR8_9BILA